LKRKGGGAFHGFSWRANWKPVWIYKSKINKRDGGTARRRLETDASSDKKFDHKESA